MNRATVLSLCVGASILAALGLSASRLAAASSGEETARVALKTLVAEVEDLERLRAAAPAVGTSASDSSSVLARVNEVLADVGLLPEQLSKLSADVTSASSMRAGIPSRRAMRLSFSGVTPSELGKFLARWRERQPGWTPTRIDLSPRRREQASRLDVTLVLSAWDPSGGVR